MKQPLFNVKTWHHWGTGCRGLMIGRFYFSCGVARQFNPSRKRMYAHDFNAHMFAYDQAFYNRVWSRNAIIAKALAAGDMELEIVS